MAIMAPPSLPTRPGHEDDDHIKRLRMRMTQVAATMVTLLGTGWFCSFGPIPGIFAIMVAKHVLVAVVIMGLDSDKKEVFGRP